MDKLVYEAPPVNVEESSRRVYVLPVSLVKRIHRYGFANGCQSEVAAVRKLLEEGLNAAEGIF